MSHADQTSCAPGPEAVFNELRPRLGTNSDLTYENFLALREKDVEQLLDSLSSFNDRGILLKLRKTRHVIADSTSSAADIFTRNRFTGRRPLVAIYGEIPKPYMQYSDGSKVPL